MPFVPALNVIELVPEFQYPNANRTNNVLNFLKVAGGVTQQDLLDAITIYKTWFSATADTHTSNQISLVEMRARDLTTQNSFVEQQPVNPTLPGVLASPAMPGSVTFCTSFRTGKAGRSFRGRVYWNGLGESQVSGDFLTAGVGTSILNAWIDLQTQMENGGYTLCIVSRKANGVFRPTAVVSVVTSIGNVDTRVDTQRRRLIGEGQ